METERFSHQGNEYEVRVICDGETIYVKAFLQGRPANRFRYSATIEQIYDFSTILGMDAVQHLIEIAKQDVMRGIN